MERYLLTHGHQPADCGVAFAAWRGFDSPLRRGHALASCLDSGESETSEHVLVWTVEAGDVAGALELLPPWVAARTEVRRVAEVAIP